MDKKLSEKFLKILLNLEQINKIHDNIELCLLFRTTFLMVNWFYWVKVLTV